MATGMSTSDWARLGEYDRQPTRNDLIRRAFRVMEGDDTGEEVSLLFQRLLFGLSSRDAVGANDPGMMHEVRRTIRDVRAQLKRLSEELDAIDA